MGPGGTAMTSRRVDRRQAAVLAADVVGYSTMMRCDELGTLDLLHERRTLIDRLASKCGGRLFGVAGDSIMAEFSDPAGNVPFHARSSPAVAVCCLLAK